MHLRQIGTHMDIDCSESKNLNKITCFVYDYIIYKLNIHTFLAFVGKKSDES